MSNILQGLQLNELSTNKLAQYKTSAASDAKKADSEGDYKRGDKRFSGIVKATKKQFANDEKKEVAEAGNNYHANRTGFSRGQRDDERHDLDKPTQVWGLKINGKVWSKGGKDVTFTSKEAALNIRNSILKNRPDLEIGLVTKGGVAEDLDENLHQWFKEKWVRFGPDGKIRGDCARGDDSEGKPKCLPQSKAQNLGKKGRASAASRKRREDPNPERSGKAINVNTKKKSNESVVQGRDEGNFAGDTPVNLGGVVVKNLGIGDIVSYLGQKAKILAMSKTGNTSRIHIPSSMGGVTKDVLTKDLKRTSLSEEELDEACWKGYHKEGNKKMFGKTYPNCVKNEGVVEGLGASKTHLAMAYLKAVVMAPTGTPDNERIRNWQEELADEFDIEMDTAVLAQMLPQFDTQLQAGKFDKLQNRMASRGELYIESSEQGVAEEHHSENCPHCGGEMVSEELMNEKKDACYYKVKSRYKVWPSAYASGALVKCRKKGADSWGNGGKSNESIEEDQLDEKWSQKYKDSINCSNPKGFSQKAHCAGKQKNESAILKGLKL